MLMSVADKYSVNEVVNLAEATGIINLREIAHIAHLQGWSLSIYARW